MKFAKEYQRYMHGMEEELPALGLKRLKEMIKKCQATPCSPQLLGDDEAVVVAAGGSRCSGANHCYVCDESFFPSLTNELSAIVRCFNERAKRLLKIHLASTGFKKYFICFTNRSDRSHEALIRQGKNLVTYAILNAVAMRKLSKKYDKKCYSKQGQAFRTEARKMQIEILESPWLHELMAFYINLRRKDDNVAMELLGDLSLTFDDEDKPTLSCALFDSLRIDIDLTCSICLDTVFDAVSLSCGHIFCYLCSCSAASVTIVDGLESANRSSKCPLCRRAGAFPDAVRLNQLNILLRNSVPEYWQKRTQLERVERVRLAKEHWERQCRAFTGI